MLRLPKDAATQNFHKLGTSLRRKLAMVEEYIDILEEQQDTGYMRNQLVDIYKNSSNRERKDIVEALSGNVNIEFALIADFLAIDVTSCLQFFAKSPALSDDMLMDLVHHPDDRICVAIVMREYHTQRVRHYFTKCAEGLGAVAVLRRFADETSLPMMKDLAQRACSTDEGRDAILALRFIPDQLKCDLVSDWATRFALYASERGIVNEEALEQWSRSATERALLVAAHEFENVSSEEMITEFSRRNWITPSMLIRTLLTGHRRLFANLFARFSHMPTMQVDALFEEYDGRFFAAAYDQAGLPKSAIRVMAALINEYEKTWKNNADLSWAEFAQALGENARSLLNQRFGDEVTSETEMLQRLTEETMRDFRFGVMSEYIMVA